MANCCQFFCHTCYTCVQFLMAVKHFYQCGRKKEHFVLNVQWFFPSLPPPLLSTDDQCDGHLSSQGGGVSWLHCQLCQPLVQSPSQSQLPTVETSGCLWHPTPLSGTVVNNNNNNNTHHHHHHHHHHHLRKKNCKKEFFLTDSIYVMWTSSLSLLLAKIGRAHV